MLKEGFTISDVEASEHLVEHSVLPFVISNRRFSLIFGRLGVFSGHSDR